MATARAAPLARDSGTHHTVLRVEDGAAATGALLTALAGAPATLVVGETCARTPAVAAILTGVTSTVPGSRVVAVAAPLPGVESVPDLAPDRPVVAIGGGKVMDVAKLTALGLPPAELAARIDAGETAFARRQRLICLPTTAGSGSEATHFAVCYRKGRKVSVADPSLQPDVALLCPELLRSASHRQKTISALDAVAQAIESQFSRAATAESRAHARDALAVGLPALRALARDPAADVLADLQRAAYGAGRAINIAKTNLPHALSYHLTLVHAVPHGLAVALFFERYLCALDAGRAQMEAPYRDAFRDVCRELCGADAYRAGTWTALLGDCGLPARFAELETRVDGAALARSVDPERLGNFAELFPVADFAATAATHVA